VATWPAVALATLVLADQVHAAADLQADPRVQVRTGPC
jgi:hypothetical protein